MDDWMDLTITKHKRWHTQSFEWVRFFIKAFTLDTEAKMFGRTQCHFP